jgi:hypothetical protein
MACSASSSIDIGLLALGWMSECALTKLSRRSWELTNDLDGKFRFDCFISGPTGHNTISLQKRITT